MGRAKDVDSQPQAAASYNTRATFHLDLFHRPYGLCGIDGCIAGPNSAVMGWYSLLRIYLHSSVGFGHAGTLVLVPLLRGSLTSEQPVSPLLALLSLPSSVGIWGTIRPRLLIFIVGIGPTRDRHTAIWISERRASDGSSEDQDDPSGTMTSQMSGVNPWKPPLLDRAIHRPRRPACHLPIFVLWVRHFV